jgi:hypothetical protein
MEGHSCHQLRPPSIDQVTEPLLVYRLIATGKGTSSAGAWHSSSDPSRKTGTNILRNGLSPHRDPACDSYFAGTERSSRRAPFLAT